MSYQKWDIGLASICGDLSAAYNMIMVGSYTLSGIGVYGTWGEKFIQAIMTSIFSVAAQGYIGGIAINPIRFWEKRNSVSSISQESTIENVLLWR
jgi:hypothetical protein